MRLVLHANAPWAPTGYGTQAALFAPRLRDLGYEIAISAYWGLAGAGIEWQGIRVYPADEVWGNRTLKAVAAHHGDGEPCQVLALVDAWVLNPAAMPEQLAVWVPVDHDPLPPPVREFFVRSGAKPVAMSRFGEEKLREAGLEPLYCPLACDTAVFSPRDGSYRRQIGIPEEAFVVGMVAANKGLPPRKGFSQLFQAFARFRERHREALLYLHTEPYGRVHGINLPMLAQSCGLPRAALKFTDTFTFDLGISTDSLAAIYSTFDVLAAPSLGEGFGIPIVEAQACGVPVIATDWTSMPELLGAGWLVGGEPWYDGPQDSFFRVPSVDELEQALESAYRARGTLREQARSFALAYDADAVLHDHLLPTLRALERPKLEAVA